MAPEIKRGPLTPAEIAEIERLAASMKNPTAGKIARRLNRHPATVNWHMVTRGLIERPAQYRTAPYKRSGRWVYPYTPEQDARIVTLRIAGRPVTEIAMAITREFNVPRTAHSIDVRLKVLAIYPNEPESEAA